MKASWRPTAELKALVQRDALMRALRGYFNASDSLEVQTPALSAAGATDPYIDSFVVASSRANDAWLHTSPEFAMKRLLAAYATNIHQFATVFRQDESGRHHNREFALLEWYRVGYDLAELINDALNIVNAAYAMFSKPPLPLKTVSYQTAVKELCGVYPHEATVAVIAQVFAKHDRSFPDSLLKSVNSDYCNVDVDAALTLLVDEFVVQRFANDEVTALIEYPVSQASLAKLGQHKAGHAVALRAEIFLGPVELANGFEELTDADEQEKRFLQDNKARLAMGKPSVAHDKHLINALRSGLPDCAGMAMGIDRLLMVLGGYAELNEVVAFTENHA